VTTTRATKKARSNHAIWYTVIGHYVADTPFTIAVVIGKRAVFTEASDLDFFPDGVWTKQVEANSVLDAASRAESLVRTTTSSSVTATAPATLPGRKHWWDDEDDYYSSLSGWKVDNGPVVLTKHTFPALAGA
jgi:hypothetical protein